MRVLLILALAIMVAGNMIMSSLDQCTDDCRGDVLMADACEDEGERPEQTPDEDENPDGDAPCSPLCQNCARPPLAALPTLALPAAYVDTAPVAVSDPLLVAASPSPSGLFRPPRA